MTRYQAETAMFEVVRASERDPAFRVEELTKGLSVVVRQAVEKCDVPKLAELGVNPCLLIVFALAMNVHRLAFIAHLPPVNLSKEKPRWRK
jgi:hypothetical protein